MEAIFAILCAVFALTLYVCVLVTMSVPRVCEITVPCESEKITPALNPALVPGFLLPVFPVPSASLTPSYPCKPPLRLH